METIDVIMWVLLILQIPIFSLVLAVVFAVSFDILTRGKNAEK